MSVLEDVLELLHEALQVNDIEMDESTELLGGIAEFDSMAVVMIITALEEKFGFTVDDDEIDADVFETVASLAEFVSGKTTD